MAKFRSDSPICIRIVLAFLDFLSSVEAAPGIDIGRLTVVRECLEEVFKVNQMPRDNRPPTGLLANLFTSPAPSEPEVNQVSNAEIDSEVSSTEASAETASTSSGGHASFINIPEDELYRRFCHEIVESLKIPMDKAKQIFEDAMVVMTQSGGILNINKLAEALIFLGNKAIYLKMYSEAVDLFTCAVSLVGDNAEYLAYRSVALTKLNRYVEAISDCYRAIKINPRHVRAYKYLGMAYYGQGNYIDAICNGFLEALKLRPNHSIVANQISMACQKLKEQHQQFRLQVFVSHCQLRLNVEDMIEFACMLEERFGFSWEFCNMML